MSTPMSAGQIVADVKLNLADFDRGISRIEQEKKRVAGGQWTTRGQFDGLLNDIQRLNGVADQQIATVQRLGGGYSDAGEAGRVSMGRVAAGAAIGTYAVSATFDAVSRLRQALTVTGDEAYTTGGRIKNTFGGLFDVLSGKPVTGIERIVHVFTDDRPARTTAGIAAAIQKLKDDNDALYVSEEKLLALRAQGQGALSNYVSELQRVGAINESTATSILKVTSALNQQAAAAEAARAQAQALSVSQSILEQRSHLPAGFEAAIARERSQGDKPGEIKALQVADRRLGTQIEQVRSGGPDVVIQTAHGQIRKAQASARELSEALTTLYNERAAIRDRIAALQKDDSKDVDLFAGIGLPPGLEAAIAREEGPNGNAARLLSLLNQADQRLARDIERAKQNTTASKADVSRKITELRRARNGIQEEIARLTEAGPIVSLVNEERLARAQLQGVKQTVAALRAIERELAERIKTETDINRLIAEEQRLGQVRAQIVSLTRGNGISDLFQGPVLSSPEFKFAEQFGFKPRGKDLLADIQAQVAQRKAFIAEITKLQKEGAPAGLVQEFASRGPGSIDELRAIADGPAGLRSQYFSQYKQLASFEQRIDTMDVTANTVTINAADVHVPNPATPGTGAGGGPGSRAWATRWDRNV